MQLLASEPAKAQCAASHRAKVARSAGVVWFTRRICPQPTGVLHEEDIGAADRVMGSAARKRQQFHVGCGRSALC
jgi:hypothetical protein